MLPSVLSWQRYGTICALRGLGRPALASVLKDTSKQDTYTSCRNSSRLIIYTRKGSFRGSRGTPQDDDSHTFISATHALRSMKTTTNVTSSGPWGSPHSGWSLARMCLARQRYVKSA